jgi:gamma-glutamyltranspeptidase/glutathione hydrolase
MVATTQPVAARIGVEVLAAGGTAADAAVAVAAALAVAEPRSKPPGGHPRQ